MSLIREVREKLAGLRRAMELGGATDYPGYREMVGRIASLREIEVYYEDRQAEAAAGFTEGDGIDEDEGAPV